MWYIVLSLVVLGGWIGFCIEEGLARRGNSDTRLEWFALGAGLGSLGWATLLFALSAFIIPAATGMDPDYSQGEVVGHITQVAREGIIWKTNEIWIALTIEEGLAFQSPRKLSVPDPVLWDMLAQGVGQKVGLHYNGWLVMPFRRGGTNYEVTAVEWLK